MCGRYDSRITTSDPFPDRAGFHGPDPTLAGIDRVFSSGINKRIRGEIGINTDREYHLLSHEVNKSWKIDFERHALASQVGATDDLRFGMSLNPHLKVFISHGTFDLVTPYYASNRIQNLMRLDPTTARNLTMRHFHGGHMFYAWESSRVAFRDTMDTFYASALRAPLTVSTRGGQGRAEAGVVEATGQHLPPCSRTVPPPEGGICRERFARRRDPASPASAKAPARSGGMVPSRRSLQVSHVRPRFRGAQTQLRRQRTR